MRLWPTRNQWNGWSLPSKLTALGALLALISLLLYLTEKAIDVTRYLDGEEDQTSIVEVPELGILFTNKSSDSVQIYRRSEFILWFPTRVQPGVRTMTGKLEIKSIEKDGTSKSTIAVPSRDSVWATATVLNSSRFAPVMGGKEADLSLKARTSDGDLIISESLIPFTKRAFEKYRLEVEIGQDNDGI